MTSNDNVIQFPRTYQTDIDALTAERDLLNASNQKRVTSLIQAGMQLDGASLLMLRLDALVETLVAEPEARMRFEIAFENRMADLFQQAESQMTAAKLGVAPTSGLIIP